jgi:hypothetical protein
MWQGIFEDQMPDGDDYVVVTAPVFDPRVLGYAIRIFGSHGSVRCFC